LITDYYALRNWLTPSKAKAYSTDRFLPPIESTLDFHLPFQTVVLKVAYEPVLFNSINYGDEPLNRVDEIVLNQPRLSFRSGRRNVEGKMLVDAQWWLIENATFRM